MNLGALQTIFTRQPGAVGHLNREYHRFWTMVDWMMIVSGRPIYATSRLTDESLSLELSILVIIKFDPLPIIIQTLRDNSISTEKLPKFVSINILW